MGVARQYTGTPGRIGNCRVAVTATLCSGVRAWLSGAAVYLPEEWLTDRARCKKARIPTTVVFQKKWVLALGLLRDALAAGFEVAAVLADAGYGDVAAFRAALHAWHLVCAVGIASTTSVFRGTPQLQPPTRTDQAGRAASASCDAGAGRPADPGERARRRPAAERVAPGHAAPRHPQAPRRTPHDAGEDHGGNKG